MYIQIYICMYVAILCTFTIVHIPIRFSNFEFPCVQLSLCSKHIALKVGIGCDEEIGNSRYLLSECQHSLFRTLQVPATQMRLNISIETAEKVLPTFQVSNFGENVHKFWQLNVELFAQLFFQVLITKKYSEAP